MTSTDFVLNHTSVDLNVENLNKHNKQDNDNKNSTNSNTNSNTIYMDSLGLVNKNRQEKIKEKIKKESAINRNIRRAKKKEAKKRRKNIIMQKLLGIIMIAFCVWLSCFTNFLYEPKLHGKDGTGLILVSILGLVLLLGKND